MGMRVRAGQVARDAGASAHGGFTRRPPPLPHPLKGFEGVLSSSDLPPRRAASEAEGLPPVGCAHSVNTVALPRHGIVRMPVDASAPSAQSPGNRHNLGLPVTAPFGASTFLIGLPLTRRPCPDWSFHKSIGNHACQSGSLLGYCVHYLISNGEGGEDP
jgi:hypothetical protein